MASRIEHDNLVTVLVGATEKRFIIHADLLAAKSPFFEAAMHKGWPEGQSKTVRLPEQDEEVFTAYFRWVYAEVIDLSQITETLDVQADPQRGPSYLSHARVWVLGNYLQDFQLCNRLTDELIKRAKRLGRGIHPRTLKLVWESTSSDEPLRKLFVAISLAQEHPESFRQTVEQWPHDMIVTMAGKYLEREARPACPGMADRCKYHIHADGKPACEK